MKTITDKTVKFLLKDTAASRATLIYLVFRYENKRFVTSTGQTIGPAQWDAERQRASTDPKLIRNKRGREANETINAHLERHRSALLKVLNSLHLAQIPFSNETIKQHLDNALGRTKKTVVAQAKPTTFLAYIDQFILDAHSGKRLSSKSHRYAAVTIKGFSRLKSALERYHQETGRGISYDNFTIDFYHEFKSWLTDRGLTLNYVGALLKDFKLLLKLSYNEGLHANTFFQHSDFKRLAEEVDNIYLSSEELTQLSQLDLSHNARLSRIRDLFLIGCYTGLRFSDFSELRPENITHNGQILTRKTLKTGGRVSIPLNPTILAILKKYDGVPPRTITNQRMNTYLKELCRLAGFTERVEVGRTKGGFRQMRVMEKWELITTHTARRSFATNAFLAGVPTVSIMKITGHKSESIFMRYIKISSEQNALLMLGHEHFK
ncbi:site-specific integrase [Spirosoma endbachense]|uniref:Tyrosine-type recombinase/integrase n=1 Tax=Spirosoma endbachense TaxID=2666025 RepID=A0A6P1VYV3_9BACT|nr:site-specific integrase [Spirosoma endbachense]QHV97282.1 tyrosine-type recombinase/integrase [Spirosoma endbachense]